MKLADLRKRIAASAWTPLASKCLAVAAALVALSAIGAGAFDHLFGKAMAHEALAHATVATPASSALAPPASSVAMVDAGPPEDASAPDAGSPAGITPDGKVALNSATEDDLRRLPGIGASKARAILKLRAKVGRFKRVEDLLRVKGIGRRSIAKLRPLVVFD